MEFFHNISKSQNLKELEHSIFLLQIQKELTTNWEKNSNLLKLQNWIIFLINKILGLKKKLEKNSKL
jgi:hypothetical protein